MDTPSVIGREPMTAKSSALFRLLTYIRSPALREAVRSKGTNPAFCCHFYRLTDGLSFGFGGIHKGFVSLAVCIRPTDFFLRHGFGHVLCLIPKFLFHLFDFRFFRHVGFLLFYTSSVFAVFDPLCGA